jgi:hypothetical protein
MKAHDEGARIILRRTAEGAKAFRWPGAGKRFRRSAWGPKLFLYRGNQDCLYRHGRLVRASEGDPVGVVRFQRHDSECQDAKTPRRQDEKTPRRQDRWPPAVLISTCAAGRPPGMARPAGRHNSTSFRRPRPRCTKAMPGRQARPVFGAGLGFLHRCSVTNSFEIGSVCRAHRGVGLQTPLRDGGNMAGIEDTRSLRFMRSQSLSCLGPNDAGVALRAAGRLGALVRNSATHPRRRRVLCDLMNLRDLCAKSER